MQEPNNLSDEKNAAVPVTQPKPDNNIETLKTYIVADNIDEFNRVLIIPFSHDIFLQLLEIALEHRAVKIISALSRPQSDELSKSKSKLTKNHAKTLLHLVGVQYAEIFRSNAMFKIQGKFLNKIHSFKNKDILFAAIQGDLEVFENLTEIPEMLPKFYCPLIVYAAANNHVSLVRYLHKHKQDPHEGTYHRNAMIAAIINNATDVFDYLVETPFSLNTFFHIEQKWPVKFREYTVGLLETIVCYKRFDQFVKLVAKGAKLSQAILYLATDHGAEDIAAYCIEKSSPEDLNATMANAIRHGQTRMVRLLHSKGVSLDESNPLFLAILLNKITTVHELISLKADITGVNKHGENVLFIAAKSNDTLEILEYLLEQLKVTLSPEKLSEFLNTRLKSGENILDYLCNKPTNAWKSSDLEKLHFVLTSLVAQGAALFEDTKDANAKTLTYCHEILKASGDITIIMGCTPARHYLNCLAANTLLEKFNTTGLTLAYRNVLEYLFKYFSIIGPNNMQFKSPHHPNLTNLKNCLRNLNCLFNFKKLIIENSDSITDQCYLRLTQALTSDIKNTYFILPTFVDELSSQSLQLLAHSVLALLDTNVKNKLCLAIADRIYARAHVGEFHDHKDFEVRLFIAKTLYLDLPIQQDEHIAKKIKTCDEILGFYEFQANNTLLGLMHPAVECKQKSNYYLLSSAIKFNSILFLDFFIKTRSSYPLVVNELSLHFLQTKNPDEASRKLIGKFLNKLKGNIPRLLLILAHALSHFKVMTQREQCKTIFAKAFAQLANINCSKSDTLEHLPGHSKETLIALLKIRVEFVTSFIPNINDTINIDQLSSLDHSKFLNRYQVYSLRISQFMQQRNILPTTLLNKIELACINNLKSIAAEPSELKDPVTGKRLATEEITGASSSKHPQDERHHIQL